MQEGAYTLVDFCATRDDKRLVYIARPSHRSEDDADDAEVLLQVFAASTIEAYVMEAFPEEPNKAPTREKFPEPEFVLDCQETILSFCVSPTGNELVVVTWDGRLQIWAIGTQPRLTTSIPFHNVLEKQFEGQRDISFLRAMYGISTGGLVRRPPSTEATIHMHRHVSLETFGFVTLHTTRETNRFTTAGGHTALFWDKRNEARAADAWGIYAMINLPLLPHRTPQVHYDGNRFIAFGQDFLGFIILVYQIHSSLDSVSSADYDGRSHNTSFGREASGGVYNFESSFGVPRVRFVNRIRHSALGGFERSEHLQMTCNERFLVFHTKTGDQLHEGPPSTTCSDGVLVIDLQDTAS